MSDTDKPFSLNEITHPLTTFHNLDEKAKAMISDEQLEEYRELHNEFRKKHQDDVDIAYTINRAIEKHIQNLYGSYSRQHKYFERESRKGDNIVDTHLNKYPSPDKVEREVKQAKKIHDTNNFAVANVGGGNVEEVNASVKYLMANDMVFGTDFSVGNAVDMAKAVFMNEFSSNQMMKDVVHTTDDNFVFTGTLCSDCKADLNYDPTVLQNKEMKAICQCHDETYYYFPKFNKESEKFEVVLTNNLKGEL